LPNLYLSIFRIFYKNTFNKIMQICTLFLKKIWIFFYKKPKRTLALIENQQHFKKPSCFRCPGAFHYTTYALVMYGFYSKLLCLSNIVWLWLSIDASLPRNLTIFCKLRIRNALKYRPFVGLKGKLESRVCSKKKLEIKYKMWYKRPHPRVPRFKLKS
jgi:hypothetical protein